MTCTILASTAAAANDPYGDVGGFTVDKIVPNAELALRLATGLDEVGHRRVQKGKILLPRGVVAHIVAPEVHAHLECVISTLDRQIIDQLPLRNSSSLRKEKARRNVIAARPESGHVGIPNRQHRRKSIQRRLLIRALKDSR